MIAGPLRKNVRTTPPLPALKLADDPAPRLRLHPASSAQAAGLSQSEDSGAWRRIVCPGCGVRTALPADQADGSPFECVRCGRRLRVPERRPRRAASPAPARRASGPSGRSGSMFVGSLATASLLLVLVGSLMVFKNWTGGAADPAAGEVESEAGVLDQTAVAAADVLDDDGTPAIAAAAPAAPIVSDLAREAHRVLKIHCHGCHGEGGSNEGGLNFILRRERLTAGGDEAHVIPGRAADSYLFQRIRDGEMPPEGEGERLEPSEIEALRAWIDAGAPDFAPPPERPFLTNDAMFQAIRRDLEAANPRDRGYMRYFTLVHLHNAGFSDDEIESYRLALAKLANSLSWSRALVQPAAVDAAGTILRIDMRDLGWSGDVWSKLVAADPYAIEYHSPFARFCREQTGCHVPHLRADWFVSAASQAPLYYDALQIPAEQPLDRLQDLLHVNIQRNIEQGRVARAGFGRSGVSQNNRMIERHPSSYGALWISYDFAGNVGRRNLFAHPMGPGGDASYFEHDGGEVIFNLPNGLQGYLLIDADGRRLDKGPQEIVTDPRRPDRAVVNGISCMACHYNGVIPKSDDVRRHVETNLAAFTNADDILALYVPQDRMSALQAEDAARFQEAVRRLGLDRLTETGEPVVNMKLRFEADLDGALAAAEFGLTPDEFSQRMSLSPRLARQLGLLNVAGGTVKRDAFAHLFGEAAREFGIGEPVGAASPAPQPIASQAPVPNQPVAPNQPLPHQPAVPAPVAAAEDADGYREWHDRDGTLIAMARLVRHAGPTVRLMPKFEPDGGPQFRTWTPNDGFPPFEAMFMGIEGDLVRLKYPNGVVVRGPILGMSREDREYIAHMAAAPPVLRPRPITVRFDALSPADQTFLQPPAEPPADLPVGEFLP